MDPSIIGSMAWVLATYGPWALVAILMGVVAWQQKAMRADAATHKVDTQTLNDKLVASTAKVTEALTESRHMLTALKDLMEQTAKLR